MHWLCSEVPPGELFAVRDNLVRQTIDEVAIKAGLKFIVNDVPGSNDRIAGAFAGHPVLAHKQACDFAKRICQMSIKEKTDIVIADTYPADIDFWQALKGVNAAYGAVKDGGTVICVTPCPEGASSQHKELTTIGYIPVQQIRQFVSEGKLDKAIGANLLLGRQLLDKADAILVTKGISEKDTKAMGFGWAPDPKTALQKAIGKHSESASINILYKASKMICMVGD
jgi:lactate racemase